VLSLLPLAVNWISARGQPSPPWIRSCLQGISYPLRQQVSNANHTRLGMYSEMKTPEN